MGFDEGHVILNNKNNTYHAGETIYGKLEFQQKKPKTFRGIYVKIKGFAHVLWTTSHSRTNSDGRTEHYTVDHNAHEDYLSMKQYLVGGENGEHHLQAGNYSFDFQCPIPAHCPSSFEHKYGHIRYEIKIVVDRAFKFDQEKKMSIRVISPLDLNQDPYCKEPLVFSCDDTYSCCCVSSGFSEVLVKLPVAGYCPEQIIPVELHCSNNSNVEIEEIKLSIIKKMRFIAKHNPDTKYETDHILEIRKGPIEGFSTRNWTVDIKIPSIDIYNVDACGIIDIEYEFKVKIVPSGCHSDSTDAKKIVLGTIPLVEYQNNMPHQVQMPQVQTQNYTSYPVSKPPYPLPEASHPSAYPVKPGATPMYPGANPPYPSANLPYPASSPSHINANSAIDAKVNLPYPAANPPYPAANPPYPITHSPYPNPNPGLGFRVPGMEQSDSPIPVTSVIVAPSAPEPSTPDDDKKPVEAGYNQGNINTSNYNYPYNPEFMSRNKE